MNRIDCLQYKKKRYYAFSKLNIQQNRLSLKQLIIFIILCLVHSPLWAQVTIGSDKAPISGALLQLKEFEIDDPRSQNTNNSTKGLMLPRVELKAIDGDLGASLGQANGSLDKDVHIGLIVFNLNTDLCSTIKQGMYTWDGDKGCIWQARPK